MRLIFNSRFSLEGLEKWRFENPPLFSSTNQRFKQLQLRNSTQDSWPFRDITSPGLYTPLQERATYLREIWAREVYHQMSPLPSVSAIFPDGIDRLGGDEPSGNLVAHRRWVNLFINGLYWGIYDLTERVDEDFAQTYLDAGAEYDVLKSSAIKNGLDQIEVAGVDLQTSPEAVAALNAWDDMLSACDNAESDWPGLLSHLDLTSYFDYLIVNLYMHNGDWGSNGNNMRAVRRRLPGSKWRFVVWDAEVSMSPSAGSDTYWTENGGAALTPHNRLKGIDQYKLEFRARLNHHYDSANGVFSVSGGTHKAASIFQTVRNEIEPLIPLESARWGDGGNPGYSYRLDDTLNLPEGGFGGDFTRAADYLETDFIVNRRSVFRTAIEALTTIIQNP